MDGPKFCCREGWRQQQIQMTEWMAKWQVGWHNGEIDVRMNKSTDRRLD